MLGTKRPRENTINHPVYSMSITDVDSSIFNSQPYYTSVNRYLHLSNGNHINDSACSALELYGAQACRANCIGRLLFTLETYQAKNIPFHAILILNGQRNNEVTVAILFDKASDVEAEQFVLRFVWWTPQNRHTIFKDDMKSILAAHIPGLYDIPEKLFSQYYAKQYPHLLKDMPPVADFIASKSNIGTLISQSHILSSTDLDGLECVSERLSEVLNYRVYKGTSLSDNLKSIAYQQALYLRREEGYDFSPYNGRDTDGLTFYFIVTHDKASCVGSLIFKKMANTCKQVTSNCLQTFEAFNQIRRHKIPFEIQDQYSFFEKKARSAKGKYMAAKRTREAANHGCYLDIFSILSDNNKSLEERKQENRALNYQQAKFAAGMILDEPSLDILNHEQIMELRSAWIHPYFRRQGILTALWPKLIENYHIFTIDQPSRVMHAFLEKQNSLGLTNDNSLCAYKP